MAAEPESYMSVEEYLAFDRAADYKHEYIDGHVYAMAGGTRDHGLLGAVLITTVGQRLRGTDCRIYSSDMRVQVAATRFVYPDASVGCDPRDWGPGDILNYPQVVFEVLSDSSEAFDRGEKFELYASCPSVQEYVLVNQRKPRIEVYRRSGDEWILHAFGAGDEVRLMSVDVTFSVHEVYENVAFDA